MEGTNFYLVPLKKRVKLTYEQFGALQSTKTNQVLSAKNESELQKIMSPRPQVKTLSSQIRETLLNNNEVKPTSSEVLQEKWDSWNSTLVNTPLDEEKVLSFVERIFDEEGEYEEREDGETMQMGKRDDIDFPELLILMALALASGSLYFGIGFLGGLLSSVQPSAKAIWAAPLRNLQRT